MLVGMLNPHEIYNNYTNMVQAMFVAYDGIVDPAKPRGTCGVSIELHNQCSRLDWKEGTPDVAWEVIQVERDPF